MQEWPRLRVARWQRHLPRPVDRYPGLPVSRSNTQTSGKDHSDMLLAWLDVPNFFERSGRICYLKSSLSSCPFSIGNSLTFPPYRDILKSEESHCIHLGRWLLALIVLFILKRLLDEMDKLMIRLYRGIVQERLPWWLMDALDHDVF